MFTGKCQVVFEAHDSSLYNTGAPQITTDKMDQLYSYIWNHCYRNKCDRILIYPKKPHMDPYKWNLSLK